MSHEVESQRDLVVERRVAVAPETVFRYFTDRERWMRWQGVDADIDLRPGGAFRVNVTGDGYASGRFTEVIENRRVVFTCGSATTARFLPDRPPSRSICSKRTAGH
jgi:uncharacterized protein YndB with AHSA1/START domain